jgi:hypothetical protein
MAEKYRAYLSVFQWLPAKFPDTTIDSSPIPDSPTDFRVNPGNLGIRVIKCSSGSRCVRRIHFALEQGDHKRFDKYMFVLIGDDEDTVQAIRDKLMSETLPATVSVTMGCISKEGRFVEKQS